MSEMYGHTWLRDQGDEPNDTWVRGLTGLSAADLGRGLRACLDGGKTFPPSLPEFRAMCLPNHGMTAMELAAHREFPRGELEDLTAKERRQKQGLAELQALRQSIGI